MGTAEPIDWQPAHAGHRYALQQFVCADPAKRVHERFRGPHHPRPWELEVQSHMRGLRPTLPEGQALLLGFRGEAVAAASHFGFDSEGTDLIIFALGRHVDHRGEGVGAAVLERTLTALHATKLENGLVCPVYTRIWDRNEASERLFTAAGFEMVGGTGKPGLRLWGHPLP